MIRNFRHKALKALYEQNDASGLNPHNWRMIFRFEGKTPPTWIWLITTKRVESWR